MKLLALTKLVVKQGDFWFQSLNANFQSVVARIQINKPCDCGLELGVICTALDLGAAGLHNTVSLQTKVIGQPTNSAVRVHCKKKGQKLQTLKDFIRFVCLLENFSLIWRHHYYQCFDLCSALMAIEQLGFFSMPHLLWHRISIYNGNLQKPVTLTPKVYRRTDRHWTTCDQKSSLELSVQVS